VDFSRPSADRGVPPEPALYTLVPADSGVPGTIFLRTGTKAPPASMAGAILAITTPGLEHASAGAMRPMDQVLNASLEPIERYARLLGALSGLALVLALIGMYGVLAYHVASHQRELGIRAAIGAAPRTLIGHVARDAGVLLLLGIVPGVGLSMVSGRVLAALVLGGNDSIVGPLLMAVAVTIAGCAVATLPPALRAARIAPAEVLRDQAR
jgi:ABC-type antimicrobial peptide transport system permease subunit